MSKDEVQLRLYAFLMGLCHLCHEHRMCIDGGVTIEFYIPEEDDTCRIPARYLYAGPRWASADLGEDGTWLEMKYTHLYHRWCPENER